MPGRGDHLAEVVRGHVGGHADGDAGGPVDEQVGQPGREHLGLGLGAVVVRLEVDGVLVDRADHLQRRRGQPGLGVPHRGRCVVAAERAEVPVPVHQWQAHRERLRHPDQRVVDGAVAVRVQPPHDLADHAGTLDVAAVGAQPHFAHLVEDPALHRLQAVPGVRQRALVDDRVGIFEVAAPHLLGDVNVEDVLFEILRGRGCGGASGHVRHCAACDRQPCLTKPRGAGSGGPPGRACLAQAQPAQARTDVGGQVAQKPPST